METIKRIVDAFIETKQLTRDDLQYLLAADQQDIQYLKDQAKRIADERFHHQIYIRGLIEFSNICKNNCYYCGIRAGNSHVHRYRLDKQTVLECCKEGYALGFRTFVLQSGEDASYHDDELVEIISSIKHNHPDCAITLSIGEKSKESYQKYFDAGCDRYLLRHETANEKHYQSLHPSSMSLTQRKQCLKDLKDIGYQVGCGFMVGSPNQSIDTLYQDLLFIKTFKPQMVGIGPFIPASHTPFEKEKAGTLEMTLRLLSIIRILHPDVLLPATTALATIAKDGREQGIYCGANVVMPNLSPKENRKDYSLYNNKKHSHEEAAESVKSLKDKMERIGYHVVVSRGDYEKKEG